MTVRQLPAPRFRLHKADGTPAYNWYVYTYETDGVTPKPAYTTSAGDVPHANPIRLDARGEKEIWWDGAYYLDIRDENNVSVFTISNYGSESAVSTSVIQSLLENSSFETDSNNDGQPDKWTIVETGTVALDTSVGNQAHGQRALKFTSTGSGGGTATSEGYFPIRASENILIDLAMKSSVADVRNLVEILYYDEAKNAISTVSLLDDSTTNPTAWTRTILQAAAPSTARFGKLRLTGCHSSDPTNGSTWYDDVRITTGPVARGAALTAAATLVLGKDGFSFDVNGNTGISAIALRPSGTIIRLRFASNPKLTHNAANIDLRDAEDYWVYPGDIVEFESFGTGWREIRRSAQAVCGDAQLTYRAAARAGWIMANDGSIGSATSGASTRANADTEALYTQLWNNISDTYAPVSTGRGANAAADFAANKTLTLSRTLGRALARAGAGSGLTSRALGEYLGAETETPTIAKTATHNHNIQAINGNGGSNVGLSNDGSSIIADNTTAVRNKGSDTPFSIVQPTAHLNVTIKL